MTRKRTNAELFEQERLILDATELLCRLMEEQGVSRKELANRLGKSKSYVTQVLDGRNMTIRTLADLAGCLGNKIVIAHTPLRTLSEGPEAAQPKKKHK